LKWLDRVLQRWRIAKAGRYIGRDDRVLDVGCADGALFVQLEWIAQGLGIDPDTLDTQVRNIPIRRGDFPRDVPAGEEFDVIAALAVFEHIPPGDQDAFVEACRTLVKSKGRVVLSIPAPVVDHIIAALQLARVLRGMEAEQHWGFDPKATIPLFVSHGFAPQVHRRFQMGLNHLFVFTAP